MLAMVECQTIQYDRLTFLLDDRITVKTNLQSFYLQASEHYWNGRIKIVRNKIESGQVKTLEELATVCGDKVKWVSKYV